MDIGMVSYFLIFKVMLNVIYFSGTSNTELPGKTGKCNLHPPAKTNQGIIRITA
jgi:hypothetical protein